MHGAPSEEAAIITSQPQAESCGGAYSAAAVPPADPLGPELTQALLENLRSVPGWRRRLLWAPRRRYASVSARAVAVRRRGWGLTPTGVTEGRTVSQSDSHNPTLVPPIHAHRERLRLRGGDSAEAALDAHLRFARQFLAQCRPKSGVSLVEDTARGHASAGARTQPALRALLRGNEGLVHAVLETTAVRAVLETTAGASDGRSVVFD